jgi:hypothetical protein
MKTKSTINVLGKEYIVQFNPITKERYFAGIPAENLDEICEKLSIDLNINAKYMERAFSKVGYEALNAQREKRTPKNLGEILTENLKPYFNQ